MRSLLALALLLLATPAHAQCERILHVEEGPFTICPRDLATPDCPIERYFRLDLDPIDPDRILPVEATTDASLVDGAYGVPLNHCRIDGVGFSIPTNPDFQVDGNPQVKSPAVAFSVIPVSNGKEMAWYLRVMTQPCQRAPWVIRNVVVREITLPEVP